LEVINLISDNQLLLIANFKHPFCWMSLRAHCLSRESCSHNIRTTHPRSAPSLVPETIPHERVVVWAGTSIISDSTTGSGRACSRRFHVSSFGKFVSQSILPLVEDRCALSRHGACFRGRWRSKIRW